MVSVFQGLKTPNPQEEVLSIVSLKSLAAQIPVTGIKKANKKTAMYCLVVMFI
jgi:hypothetical protein